VEIALLDTAVLPAGSNPTWNEGVFRLFEQFRDPLVYTPGDNEWTDCHKKKQSFSSSSSSARAAKEQASEAAAAASAAHAMSFFIAA
jgi:hypothetical protein